MKAIYLVGGKIQIVERPKPKCEKNEVLVRHMCTAVSPGTELHIIRSAAADANRGIGYIVAGVIEEAAGNLPVQTGDHVFCWGPMPNTALNPYQRVVKAPASLDFKAIAASYWAVPAMRGIHRLRPWLYDDLAVIGQGPIGLMGLQMLRHMSRKLIAVDINPIRLKKSAEFGADLCVNPAEQDAVKVIGGLCPEGPQGVIEASGTREGLKTALEIVRPRGTIVTLRIAADLSGLNLEFPMYAKDLQLMESGSPGMWPPDEFAFLRQTRARRDGGRCFPRSMVY